MSKQLIWFQGTGSIRNMKYQDGTWANSTSSHTGILLNTQCPMLLHFMPVWLMPLTTEDQLEWGLIFECQCKNLFSTRFCIIISLEICLFQPFKVDLPQLPVMLPASSASNVPAKHNWRQIASISDPHKSTLCQIDTLSHPCALFDWYLHDTLVITSSYTCDTRVYPRDTRALILWNGQEFDVVNLSRLFEFFRQRFSRSVYKLAVRTCQCKSVTALMHTHQSPCLRLHKTMRQRLLLIMCTVLFLQSLRRSGLRLRVVAAWSQ
jgi:hypothetical protein